MTLKGLVFGDSHAGMLVEALQHSRPGPVGPVTLDFLVKPGSGPRGFDIKGSRVVPTDPKLAAFLEKIEAPAQPDLSNYDFLAIVGCGVSIYPIVQTASKVAVTGGGRAAHFAGLQPVGGQAPLRQQLISTQAFRQTIRDRLSGSHAFTLLSTLSNSSDLPVFMVPQPRPRILLKDIPKRGKGFADIVRFADQALISNTFDEIVRKIGQEIAPCHYLAQPAQTIDDHIFTVNRFFRGSTRLSNPGMRQNRRDVIHTNAEYGDLILKQFQQILGEESRS